MKVAIGFAIAFIAASPAFAQIDTFTLRSKFGVPLDRETFTVRPGVEMTVDYGPSKQVCRIRLPSGKQIEGTIPPGVITKQQIEEVLNEVIPLSMRGREINQMVSSTGGAMAFMTDYENVEITDVRNAAIGISITVTFKNPACPRRTTP